MRAERLVRELQDKLGWATAKNATLAEGMVSSACCLRVLVQCHRRGVAADVTVAVNRFAKSLNCAMTPRPHAYKPRKRRSSAKSYARSLRPFKPGSQRRIDARMRWQARRRVRYLHHLL